MNTYISDATVKELPRNVVTVDIRGCHIIPGAITAMRSLHNISYLDMEEIECLHVLDEL